MRDACWLWPLLAPGGSLHGFVVVECLNPFLPGIPIVFLVPLVLRPVGYLVGRSAQHSRSTKHYLQVTTAIDVQISL